MADIIKITEENFENEVLNSDIPTVVDFFATWCGPCKMLSPIIEKLAGEVSGRAKVCKADVDEVRDIAQQYNIMSVPSVLIFNKGNVVRTLVGVRQKEDYINEINNL